MHNRATNQVSTADLLGYSVFVERYKFRGQRDHFGGSAVLTPPFDRLLAERLAEHDFQILKQFFVAGI